MRRLEKLNIRIHFSIDNHGNGYNSVPKKMLSGIKSDFFEFCSIINNKYRIAMTFPGNFCDVISLKVEKPIT